MSAVDPLREAKAEAARAAWGSAPVGSLWLAVVDAIEAITNPPEPTEWGSIVRDADGALWVFYHVGRSGSGHWYNSERGGSRDWDGIPGPVTILRTGVCDE